MLILYKCGETEENTVNSVSAEAAQIRSLAATLEYWCRLQATPEASPHTDTRHLAGKRYLYCNICSEHAG